MPPPESRAPADLTPQASDGRAGGDRGDAEILLLSRPQVARVLQVSPAHVSRLHASGRLPRPRRLGRAVRWSETELRAWIQAGCPPRDRWEALMKAGRKTP